ncbi:MAG: hypothetical protein ACXVIJ_15220, partial [Thermoanaerobaculia bacterium]
EDRITVVLNLALLFTVLFFVFPLKFLFGILLGDPSLKHAMVQTAHGLEPAILPQHRPVILIIFGLGFAAVFLVFLLLYRHAWKQRDDLDLNEYERYETLMAIRRVKLAMLIGLGYCGMAANQVLEQSKKYDFAVTVLNLIVLAIFFGVMAMMVKLSRERKIRRREWLSRPGDAPVDSSTTT